MELYKVKGAIKRNRPAFIVALLIWILIAITYGYAVAERSHNLYLGFSEFGRVIKNPFAGFDCMVRYAIIPSYLSNLFIATLIYGIFFFIGFVKAAPKNEYTDIEHGSSDWSKHGEQYEIVSKKERNCIGKG